MFKARSLLTAAELCWSQFDSAIRLLSEGKLDRETSQGIAVGGPAHMLAGMGLEVMLKAILIIKQPDLASAGGKVFYKHDLKQFAEQVAQQYPEITWAPEELITLTHLGQFVEWSGRYPIPRWDKDSAKAKFDFTVAEVDGKMIVGGEGLPGSHSPDTWNRVWAIVQKVFSFYVEKSNANGSTAASDPA